MVANPIKQKRHRRTKKEMEAFRAQQKALAATTPTVAKKRGRPAKIKQEIPQVTVAVSPVVKEVAHVPKPPQEEGDKQLYIPATMDSLNLSEPVFIKFAKRLYGEMSPNQQNEITDAIKKIDTTIEYYIIKQMLIHFKFSKTRIDEIIEETKNYNPKKIPQLYYKWKKRSTPF